VTRGRLPQTAGLPGLNGSGAAAAVPPQFLGHKYTRTPLLHWLQRVKTKQVLQNTTF